VNRVGTKGREHQGGQSGRRRPRRPLPRRAQLVAGAKTVADAQTSVFPPGGRNGRRQGRGQRHRIKLVPLAALEERDCAQRVKVQLCPTGPRPVGLLQVLPDAAGTHSRLRRRLWHDYPP